MKQKLLDSIANSYSGQTPWINYYLKQVINIVHSFVFCGLASCYFYKVLTFFLTYHLCNFFCKLLVIIVYKDITWNMHYKDITYLSITDLVIQHRFLEKEKVYSKISRFFSVSRQNNQQISQSISSSLNLIQNPHDDIMTCLK